MAHRVDVATAYLRASRYDEAVESARRAIEFDQTDARGYSTLGWGLLGVGRQDEGLSALEHAVELAPMETLWLAQLGEAYAVAGIPDRAREILDRLTERSRARYVAPYHLAYVYVGLHLA